MIRPLPARGRDRCGALSVFFVILLTASASLPMAQASELAAPASTIHAPSKRIADISRAVASRVLGHRSSTGRLREQGDLVGAIAHRLAVEVEVPQEAVHHLAVEIEKKKIAREVRLHAVLRNAGVVVAITFLLLLINWALHHFRQGPNPSGTPRGRRLRRYLATDPRALLVFAPVASVSKAHEIGHTFVSDRLAARVSIAGGIRRLQPGGDEAPEREAIAIIHSTRYRVKRLSRFLSQAYGYRVRDVKPYPIHWAPKAYTRWVEEATRSGRLWRRIWRYLRT